jgi:hypothetical protein
VKLVRHEPGAMEIETAPGATYVLLPAAARETRRAAPTAAPSKEWSH